MAQEILQNARTFIHSQKLLSFPMRDNGDDAFGNPLPRLDRPLHVPIVLPSSSPLTTGSSISIAPISSSMGSSSSSSPTPLDRFIQAVHQALNAGLSKETLIANIHLISDERTENSQPLSSDDFLSQ
jgi:hypothetical protein